MNESPYIVDGSLLNLVTDLPYMEQTMAIYVAGGNQKGGVGKTTMLVSLAGELAKRGMRVLMVDFDPQGHATLWLRDKNNGRRTVDALINKTPLSRCILRSKHARLDVLPGGDAFVELNLHLVLEMVVGLVQDPICEYVREHVKMPALGEGSAELLRDHIQSVMRAGFKIEAADLDHPIDVRASLREQKIADKYDVVLMDCGPTATNLLGEILRSADQALCIAVPSGLGADGTSQYIDTVAGMQADANPDLRLAGILLNNYHRERSEMDYIEAFKENWPDHTMDTVVPHDPLLMRASSGFRLNAISFYAKKAKITRCIGELTDEFLTRIGYPVSV